MVIFAFLQFFFFFQHVKISQDSDFGALEDQALLYMQSLFFE